MNAGLHVKRVGDGPPVVALHGLFGAGGNLGAVARELQSSYGVYSVDLPGHGRSPWLSPLDLSLMADCVRETLDREGVREAHLLGHSLGGKVAMQMALRAPSLARSLIVADIAPVRYGAQHVDVFAALEAVVARPCTSREEAAERMAATLRDERVIQFLLTNLQRDERGVYGWRFDLAGLKAAYPALLAAPVAERPYPGPVLFIRGGDSDYIQQVHWPAIQALFPAATLKTMPDCGHWLHAENPRLFSSIAMRFLAHAEAASLAAPRHGGSATR